MLSKTYHFYSRRKSQYIAYTCYRNEMTLLTKVRVTVNTGTAMITMMLADLVFSTNTVAMGGRTQLIPRTVTIYMIIMTSSIGSVMRKAESRCEKTGLRGFRPGPTQTRLYSHRRWLEDRNVGFRVEGLYYLYSENKVADQLRGYREADLRLSFRICKKPVFS